VREWERERERERASNGGVTRGRVVRGPDWRLGRSVMAVYRQVYGFGDLQADWRGPGSAPEPYMLISSLDSLLVVVIVVVVVVVVVVAIVVFSSLVVIFPSLSPHLSSSSVIGHQASISFNQSV